jgi:hypothetical protein
MLHHFLFLVDLFDQLVAFGRQFAVRVAHKLVVLKFLAQQLSLVNAVLLVVLLDALP